MTAPHGTITRYKGGHGQKGCRCVPCTTANREWQQRRALILPTRSPHRTVSAWKTLHDAGQAAEACDQIISAREPPARLLRALGLG